MVKLDIDMPDACAYCPCNYDHMECIITGKPFNPAKYLEERMEGCPIMPMDGTNDLE